MMPCSAASSWVSSRGNPYVSYSSKAAEPLTDAVPDPFLCADASWSTASSLFWPALPAKLILCDVELASSLVLFGYHPDMTKEERDTPSLESCC